MYGYIYKITNNINGKIYVGLHTSATFDENYWGSGSNLHEAYSKFGRDNFTREVLQECESLEEMNQAEVYWIDILDARNPEIGYNIQPGGIKFFGYKHPDCTIERLKDKASKRRKYGFWIHNDTQEKYWTDEQTIPEGFIKGRLPATMRKAGDKHRGKKSHKRVGSKTPRGSHWYTNGIEDTMAFECPEGYRPGRSKLPDNSGENNPAFGKPNVRRGCNNTQESKEKFHDTMENKKRGNSKYIWINDGVNEYQVLRSAGYDVTTYKEGKLLTK